MANYELLSEIEKYGRENKIPILLDESLDFITQKLNEIKPYRLLEIGTAIAYSTICFASTPGVEKITSIERDEERYKIASSNVRKSGLKNIELIFGDATDAIIEGKYDLLIIDAAKSQNMRFFNKYKNSFYW